MKYLLTSILAITVLPSLALPAKALVRDVSMESACQGNIPVVVFSGMGATVDFTQTGKVVQRAWLGDPSKVTLDADRPIEEGSSVLFLRRVEGLNFDGLPSAESTVLTTVLVSTSGTEVCQFPVSYRTGTPTHTSIRLLPNGGTATAATSRIAPSTIQPTTIDIEGVEAGLNLNAQSLGESNQAVIKVREFIAQVRAGADQQSTAQELGIEWPLIIELNRQGSEAPSYTDTIFL